MFYRPGGQSTQKAGVEADVVVASPFNAERFGEGATRYPLPAQVTAPFKGQDIQGKGADAWKPVTEEQIKALSERSAARVARSKGLQEVLKELKKSEAEQGVVSVAEILDDKSGKKDKEKEKEDPEEVTPQALEGLEVLADLVRLQGGPQAAQRP
jgi:hypothetical protein